jgi:acyl-coenzyme A thioesterase PaaI-like protein
VDYLRPALDPDLTVDGVTVRAGRRFAFADATAAGLDGRTVASGRATFTW